MKKFLLVLGGLFFGLFLLFILIGWSMHQPLPKSIDDATRAEALSNKMLEAIGKPAYDTLKLIEWSFPRGHHFVWEKDINKVTVSWGENKVILFPDDMQGQAFVSGIEQQGTEKDNSIKQAWSLFANDSFWLVAPFKIRDPGTQRSVVETNEGDALLVTYTSGGVTPGDSYLWHLDSEGKPVAWQMWVNIIPIGGLRFTWDSGEFYQGAWLAPRHQGPGPASVDLIIHKVE